MVFSKASIGASVFRHPQLIEDQTDIACELSHFLRNAAHAFGFDEVDGKASESGDVFRAIAGAYGAVVSIEIPVQDVVATVLDAPVAAVDGKELLGVCVVGLSAGDAVGDVMGGFPGLFFNRFPFDHEGLSHMGEVEIGVELGGGLDFSDFDPAMIRGIICDEIRSPHSTKNCPVGNGQNGRKGMSVSLSTAAICNFSKKIR